MLRTLFFTPGECPVLDGKAPRRLPLDAPYYNPLAARTDAHQRARILRDAYARYRKTPGVFVLAASGMTHAGDYWNAARRQEAIGNGQATR